MSLLTTSIFSLIGWLMIYMSTNYEKLVVGRIVGGIATGLASVSATVYAAEIAEPAWRSTMVTWSSIAIAFGILIVYIFGYIIPVKKKPNNIITKLIKKKNNFSLTGKLAIDSTTL